MGSLIENGELKIINLLGETIFSEHISKAKDVTLNVEELNKGIYFVQLKSDSSNYIQKLIKQ